MGIEIFKVQGSHFECGRQIGMAMAPQFIEHINDTRNTPPPHLSWQECLQQTKQYRAVTEQKYPYILEEINGVAAGAGVDQTELFTYFIDEFWDLDQIQKRACTDVLVTPPLTDNEIIVGHNNDLSPTAKDHITATEWTFSDDHPPMLTIGLDNIGMSVGINQAKICLTGNELSALDTRIGIPRAITVRAMLRARNYSEALATALDPDRASSYNTLIVTPDQNSVVSVEGSATSYALLYPEDGALVHSNHYTAPSMLQFEAEPNHPSSVGRQIRGEQLVRRFPKPVTRDTVAQFLRDHNDDGVPSNNTICRHGTSITVFSFIANLTTGDVEVAAGAPCENEYKKIWKV